MNKIKLKERRMNRVSVHLIVISGCTALLLAVTLFSLASAPSVTDVLVLLLICAGMGVVIDAALLALIWAADRWSARRRPNRWRPRPTEIGFRCNPTSSCGEFSAPRSHA